MRRIIEYINEMIRPKSVDDQEGIFFLQVKIKKSKFDKI